MWLATHQYTLLTQTQKIIQLQLHTVLHWVGINLSDLTPGYPSGMCKGDLVQPCSVLLSPVCILYLCERNNEPWHCNDIDKARLALSCSIPFLESLNVTQELPCLVSTGLVLRVRYFCMMYDGPVDLPVVKMFSNHLQPGLKVRTLRQN